MLRGLLFLLAFSAEAQNWPAFRGPGASGAAARQNLPLTWNVKTGANIGWKTPVPGLAHSSPIVWSDRIYLTTAVSSRPDATGASERRPILRLGGESQKEQQPAQH